MVRTLWWVIGTDMGTKNGMNIQGTNSETDKVPELNIHGANMVLI